MSVFRKLAGETVAYGFSSVLGRLLNYLLVPLYTSVFLPGEYGIVTELYAYIAFLNVLYAYGMETTYFRFTTDSDHDYFSDAFWSIFISSILFSSAIFFNAEPIAQWLGYQGQATYIKWLSLILAADAVVAIPFARLRKEGKAIAFASFKLANIFLNIGFNLFFLIWCPSVIEDSPNSMLRKIYNPELGIGYVFLSNLLANTAYLIFLMPTILKVKIQFSFMEWQKMLRYGWPILVIGFAGVTNEMLSRALLKYRLPEGFYENYNNLEALGIFGACYKLSVFMTLTVQAFRYAFEPFLFKQAKEKNSPQVFSKVMTAFVWFTSVAWVTTSLLLPVVAPIFLRNASYLDALGTVPWLLGGGLFLGVFYNLSIWYKLKDKTKYGAIITLLGALLTLIFNWVLIPLLGYMGSAVTTFFVYMLMSLISFLWGRKHYPIPYQGKVVWYVLFAGIIILIDQLFIINILFSVLLLVIYLFLLFLFDSKQISSFLK